MDSTNTSDSTQVPARGNSEFRNDRRRFMTRLGLMSAAAGAGMVGLSSSSAKGELPIGFRTGGRNVRVADTDILNFALNLEYLEAEYYLHAAFGRGLTSADVTGDGHSGTVSGGRQVSFTSSVVRAYAEEIAMDEEAHVKTLRAALGNKAVARPALSISGAFTEAAVAAGVITSGQTFDPYASDLNFLLGAFIFEDVGVTAYNGAVPYVADEGYLSAAGKILAVEAYHAGEIRTLLYGMAQSDSTIFTTVQKISDLRDTVDADGDVDQGIGNGTTANIIPTDANGLSFARTFRQVLNIVYNGPSATMGFFPNKLNGTIR